MKRFIVVMVAGLMVGCGAASGLPIDESVPDAGDAGGDAGGEEAAVYVGHVVYPEDQDSGVCPAGSHRYVDGGRVSR